MTTLNGQQLLALNYVLNNTGYITKEGLDIPRKHESSNESLVVDYNARIEEVVKTLALKDGEAVDTVEVELPMKVRVLLVTLLEETPWHPSAFVLKNDLITLLNQ